MPAPTMSPLSFTELDAPPSAPQGEGALTLDLLDLPRLETVTVTEDVSWLGVLRPSDTGGPLVEFVYPAEGGQLGLLDPIIFRVTDPTYNLGRVFVAAWNRSTDVQELVWDGTAFIGLYALTSSRSAIEGGYEYVVRRSGGWPRGAEITIRTWAVDLVGNVEEVPGGD